MRVPSGNLAACLVHPTAQVLLTKANGTGPLGHSPFRHQHSAAVNARLLTRLKFDNWLRTFSPRPVLNQFPEGKYFACVTHSYYIF